jgi:polyisoprenyl-phosphate glycosyltransferase
MNNPRISIVVPLFNESAIFQLLIERLNLLISSSSYPIEIVLIDDGSKDDTPLLMKRISLSNENYQCLFLARNYGHQIALTAGLMAANGSDAIMVIDGDLQDPPELLFKFYEHYQNGYDVVYAVRKNRKEGVLKKISYYIFYRILKSTSYIDIPLDSGDFSLISRRVVDVLNKMPEESRFIRGMRSWIGFKQIGVEYERHERQAGESKYNFKMLFRLAYNGLFNFSEFPIKFITRMGFFAVTISVSYLIYTLISRFLYDTAPQGFTALLFVIVLFGGVQLISIGVLGEYLLRIFFQVKGRPLFVVKEKIVNKKISES